MISDQIEKLSNLIGSVRQYLVYVPSNPGWIDNPEPGNFPWRLWTLFDDSPKLPFVPQHNENAFIEDKSHDWLCSHDKTKIKYFSRVAEKTWILLEYKG
jgi:hypothetical protein